MVKSVGIDLAGIGEHKVRCLDEKGQLCDGFGFETTPQGLAKLEEHIFREGSNPVIVFEPTGLAWVAVAVYLRSRHPDCLLVRTQSRNVAALRKYLRRSSKSDKIDAITLAKMPFVDAERLAEVFLPSAKIYAIQRLSRQRRHLELDISARKTRISSILDGYLPGVRKTFSNLWSKQARVFLSSRINPLMVAREGEDALSLFLAKARPRRKADAIDSHMLYQACQDAATIYLMSESGGTINDDFFTTLQDEITRELRLMDVEEAESEAITKHVNELYRELHPSDNLGTIPGVGEQTAPVFLSVIGDPARFKSQAAFANYTGVVPDSRQSSKVEAKGLPMTKAGPAIMKWALYQSADMGRRYDPQMAWLYYREMVHNGKNHKQAMGAVMSHIGSRILAVLRENKPYELRDVDGTPISWNAARRLILARYQVPEEIRRDRRRRMVSNSSSKKPLSNQREMAAIGVHKAAEAP